MNTYGHTLSVCIFGVIMTEATEGFSLNFIEYFPLELTASLQRILCYSVIEHGDMQTAVMGDVVEPCNITKGTVRKMYWASRLINILNYGA